MKKPVYLLLIALKMSLNLFAQESYLIPVDSPLYRQAEEFFLCAGVVPPYEELPLTAQDLKDQLLGLIDYYSNSSLLGELSDLTKSFNLSFTNFEPILKGGLAFGYNSEPDRFQKIPLEFGGETGWYDPVNDDSPDDGRPTRDFRSFYDLAKLPRLLTAGFILQFAGFALHGEVELKETAAGLLENSEQLFLTIPETFEQLDFTNTSFNATINYYSPFFEAAFGRSKLHSGPGQYSSLSVSKTMPYFDFFRLRFRYSIFSLYTTIISLNPIISNMESLYLDYLYDNYENPEANAQFNGKIFKDRIKNFINLHFVLRPWPWLSFSISQTNLVGGRPLDFADFNPFLIIHNNFDEGSYSCPILLSAVIVPFKGFKLYSEFLFYDSPVGDEVSDPRTTPGAIALQGGFSLLSTPFFDAGPGRFRLDAEITYVDPYCYGKYYNLRKFSSRIVYLDHNASPGRYWLDFPLGFYLGPDCLDIKATLYYGKPAAWEASISWQTTGKGEIDLYGYGDDTDYTTRPTTGPAPSGVAEWRHSLESAFYWVAFSGFCLKAWYRFSFVYNCFDPQTRNNILGANYIFHYCGFSISYSFF